MVRATAVDQVQSTDVRSGTSGNIASRDAGAPLSLSKNVDTSANEAELPTAMVITHSRSIELFRQQQEGGREQSRIQPVDKLLTSHEVREAEIVASREVYMAKTLPYLLVKSQRFRGSTFASC